MSNIAENVQKLKDKVDEINELMKVLEQDHVDVRISYVESSKTKNISQGISLWRIEQHIDYL